jgi:hypothetical protein
LQSKQPIAASRCYCFYQVLKGAVALQATAQRCPVSAFCPLRFIGKVIQELAESLFRDVMLEKRPSAFRFNQKGIAEQGGAHQQCRA